MSPPKRSHSAVTNSTTSTTTNTSYSGGISSNMKKAKSQAVGGFSSLDKNGVQRFGGGGGDDDDEVAAMDEDIKASAADAPPIGLGDSAPISGVAANLSRKKATPPQPTKKFVIKPLKAQIVVEKV